MEYLDIRVTNVYPGYILTGVSKNALIGKGDQRLGKTKLNIKNSMPVNVCCEQILRAICRGWNEVVIEQKWFMHIVVKM
jgi:hypothetical protein